MIYTGEKGKFSRDARKRETTGTRVRKWNAGCPERIDDKGM